MDLVHRTALGKLYRGDCLDLLPNLDSGSLDLVFADPPFNLRKHYAGNVRDDLADSEYMAWCGRWIRQCARLLRPGGAFFLWNLPKWNVVFGNVLAAEDLLFRHWIAVDIKYSLPIAGRLYPSHYSLLYYTKGMPRVFHRPRVPVPVCRHCSRDIKDYGGHRNKLNPLGLNLTDVWSDIPPVRHRSTKTRHANELSPKLLKRVMEIATREGDLVLDPFGGSGTTYVVAEEMKRRWIGIELGDCQPIIDRFNGSNHPIIKNAGDAGKGMRRGVPASRAVRRLQRQSPTATKGPQ